MKIDQAALTELQAHAAEGYPYEICGMLVAKKGKLPAAIDELRAVLRIQRHVPLDKPDNFAISTAA